ncbi:hypothetical protein PS691_05717 [Pseudomonas fluorescens]|uniref:Uncharacterized protein n=1 Tax=Pseudomonas fluorescens TaxID=294 RepID=A0A5E7FNL5_PSEFL|nr:hypothetical protein PS691_05717 [Pseudomonas fluorescens]
MVDVSVPLRWSKGKLDPFGCGACSRRRPGSHCCTQSPCRSCRRLRSFDLLVGVHIHSCGNGHLGFRFYSGSLSKSRSAGPVESNQSALAPFVRCLAKARHALAPVLLRGPAAIGHPWPCAANPASMPGCPLRRTSTQPLEGACTAKAKARRPTGRPGLKRTRSPVGAAEGCDLLILQLLCFGF